PWHAAAAAERARVARLRVLRPAWRGGGGGAGGGRGGPPAGGRGGGWGEVGAGRVLLTVGRYDLGAFAELGEGTKLVVRSIEAPDADLVEGATVVTARGPFTVEGE